MTAFRFLFLLILSIAVTTQASRAGSSSSDATGILDIFKGLYGVDENIELQKKGRLLGAAFTALEHYENQRTVIGKSIEGDALVAISNGACFLYMVDDTGNTMIIVNADAHVMVGEALSGSRPTSGSVSLAGKKFADLTDFDHWIDQDTGFGYRYGRPNIGLLAIPFKVTEFWGYLAYGGADLSIVMDETEVHKTISPIQGAWANGQMTDCGKLVE